MPKSKKAITEFRSYYLPAEFPVLLLTGEHWRISDRPSPHLHFHDCLELGFCHEGSGILRIRKKDLAFEANDITFISRNIPHTTFSAEGTTSKWSYFMVYMNELFESFAPGFSHQISQMLEAVNTAGIIHSSDSPAISLLMRKLISEISAAEVNYQLNARCLFLALLTELYRAIGSEAHNPAHDPELQGHTLAIVPALEYIKQNYMNQFSMESLANLCGLSPTHFRRLFNHTMGVSPLEYLNTIRITRACHLLRSTEDSILNISESVGFHSISSFNRYFGRMVGMSPREYRRTSLDDTALLDSQIMKFNGWMAPD